MVDGGAASQIEMKITTMGTPASQSETWELPASRYEKADSILHRIDLFALAVAFLGVCFLIVVVAVVAVIDLVKLVSHHWSGSTDRCLLIILGSAIVWIAVRWKQASLG